MKKALITGVTGQDGSYLAEFLLEKGYEVHGVVRRSSTFNTDRIQHLYRDPHESGVKFFLHYGDLLDASSLNNLVRTIQPDEVYNLAAQSHVRVSFDMPVFTADVVGTGTTRLLEAVRQEAPQARYYQASSSEMFGQAQEIPQKETTPFHPRSPYGCAKVFAYWATVNYRESYGLHASNGILFNHESPRRGHTFVTQKISEGLARLSAGRDEVLHLGNLDAKRDWGFAGDFVEAMWLMLQQEQGDDYVVATGQTRSVRDFAEATARCFDMELAWEGEGLKEKGIDRKTGRQVIAIDPHYYRPAEVDLLLGDSSKAQRVLNWEPQVSFEMLVKMMAEAAYARIK
jgi:GDPmannose 4,6-dehydratase